MSFSRTYYLLMQAMRHLGRPHKRHHTLKKRRSRSKQH